MYDAPFNLSSAGPFISQIPIRWTLIHGPGLIHIVLMCHPSHPYDGCKLDVTNNTRTTIHIHNNTRYAAELMDHSVQLLLALGKYDFNDYCHKLITVVILYYRS